MSFLGRRGVIKTPAVTAGIFPAVAAASAVAALPIEPAFELRLEEVGRIRLGVCVRPQEALSSEMGFRQVGSAALL